MEWKRVDEESLSVTLESTGIYRFTGLSGRLTIDWLLSFWSGRNVLRCIWYTYQFQISP